MALPTSDRFQGCLVGQALGDALGFPVEGYGPEYTSAYVDGPGFGTARDPFPLGQYTDDTQLARELLDSWVQAGEWRPEDFGQRVAAIFSEGRIVGRGRATQEAAERLAAGVPWQESGTPAPSAGNGSAMRSAPVGLMCVNDPDRLVTLAAEQSRITHADIRCQAGSVAIAAAVAIALQDDKRDPWDFCERVAVHVAKVDAEFAGHVRWLADILPVQPDAAAPMVAGRGRREGYSDEWHGISPFVVPSVLWSLYCYLRAGEEDLFMDAVRIAIRAGGDVDTTAAMTGAIAGARIGLGGLPQMAGTVNDRGTWDYDQLADLAKRAHKLL